MRAADDGEGSVQDQEGGHCEKRENSSLESESFPEYLPVVKGLKPEQVYPVRKCNAAEKQRGKYTRGKQSKAAPTARPGRLCFNFNQWLQGIPRLLTIYIRMGNCECTSAQRLNGLPYVSV